jgi:CspA family cold shock protein
MRARSRTEEEQVPQGTVKWFSTQKGYGFITQDEGGDIFVHVTGLAPGTTGLDENQRVEFELSEGRKGPQATDVKPASSPAPAAAPALAPEAEAETEDEAEAEAEAEDEAED